ncbi:MAG: hypothetical protein HC880_19660 [Bacteroidia bacterium]|nr:hypothetical protein [Bacteroidia bacterium]
MKLLLNLFLLTTWFSLHGLNQFFKTPQPRFYASSAAKQRTFIWIKHQTHLPDSASGLVEIPFRRAGNLILVEGEVNGQAGWFILDTGAPNLILNAAHQPCGRVNTTHCAIGSTGKVSGGRRVTVQRFQWGLSQLTNREVDACDLSHLEKNKGEKILGLIGINLFKNYEVVLDYSQSRLMFYRLNRAGQRMLSESPAPKPDGVIALDFRGHLPVVVAQVGRRSLLFGLDTGAEMNLLDRHFKDKIADYLHISLLGSVQGNSPATQSAIAAEVVGLTFGPLVFQKMPILLTSMAHLNAAYNTHLDGMLGFDFLSSRLMAINFIRKELYWWNTWIVRK